MIVLDDLMKSKYKVNGRGPEFYDCYGFAIAVCNLFGKALYDVLSNKKNIDMKYELECVEKSNLYEVNNPEKEADVILFKNTMGALSHIGVYLGNGQFAHCNKLGPHVDKISRYKNLIGRVYSWR